MKKKKMFFLKGVKNIRISSGYKWGKNLKTLLALMKE